MRKRKTSWKVRGDKGRKKQKNEEEEEELGEDLNEEREGLWEEKRGGGALEVIQRRKHKPSQWKPAADGAEAPRQQRAVELRQDFREEKKKREQQEEQ